MTYLPWFSRRTHQPDKREMTRFLALGDIRKAKKQRALRSYWDFVDGPRLTISQRHIEAGVRVELNAREIVYEIDSTVRASHSTYSDWRIGITDDLPGRRKRHQDEGRYTRLWKQWEADSEADARSVEAYFVDKGMKSGVDWDAIGNFVYIF